MNLSVVIITKNAEENIADAIESLDKIVDEVIIVDNGSSDRTMEIAMYMKAKVVNLEGQDFSQLRNKGLKEAKGEWILYIDADERLTEELREEVRLKINDLRFKNFTAFKIKRKNFYFGKHEWPYIERLERLFRKNSLKGWRGKLHESPVFDGQIGELDGFLFHYTHKDLSSMVMKTLEWSRIEAELRFKASHPKMVWWRFPRVMATAFLNSYIRQSGWKAGTVGLIESMYQAFSMFITYARLWEMQEKLKDKNEK